MSDAFSLGFLAAVLRISLPYVLAALGGTWSERAGVVNLALEGMLLGSAFFATLSAFFWHSAVAGIAFGVLSGGAIALLYALLVLRFRANQIVTGVALNLMMDGLTRFLLRAVFDFSSNSPRVDAFADVAGRFAGLWAFLDPVVLVTVVVLIGSHYGLYRTRFGLRVRAVGEHPQAATSVGVPVLRVRLWALLMAGLLCGLGGAWLAYQQRQFVGGMSNGRGYIAIVAVIFGKWRPGYAALAALLFGTAEAFQITLTVAGDRVPAWMVHMFPYALTMMMQAGLRGRAERPKALGSID